MDEVVFVVELEAVATEPETGRWCPHCALPSAAGVTVLFAHPRTLLVLARVEVEICADCSSSWQVGQAWRIDG